MLWAMGVGPGVEQRQEVLRRRGPQPRRDGAPAEAAGRDGAKLQEMLQAESPGGWWDVERSRGSLDPLALTEGGP